MTIEEAQALEQMACDALVDALNAANVDYCATHTIHFPGATLEDHQTVCAQVEALVIEATANQQ